MGKRKTQKLVGPGKGGGGSGLFLGAGTKGRRARRRLVGRMFAAQFRGETECGKNKTPTWLGEKKGASWGKSRGQKSKKKKPTKKTERCQVLSARGIEKMGGMKID